MLTEHRGAEKADGLSITASTGGGDVFKRGDFSFHNLKEHYQELLCVRPLSCLESKIHWKEVQEEQRGKFRTTFSQGSIFVLRARLMEEEADVSPFKSDRFVDLFL